MIKARASGSKVYLYFMKKGRQAGETPHSAEFLYLIFVTLFHGFALYLESVVWADTMSDLILIVGQCVLYFLSH